MQGISYCKRYKLEIISLVLFLVCFPVLSQSIFGATLNLTATWTVNTESDMKEYRLYRTDITRTQIGTAPYPNTSLPFTVTVPDGSAGTLLFVLRAVDTSNNESLDSNSAAYNYDLRPTNYAVSGYVRTSGGAGVSGVGMSGLPGNPTTDSNGYYSGTVSAGWSGTVTPSKSGYTFSPASRSYNNVTSDQTGGHYTATATTVTISGNAGVAGATLSYTDGTPKTATADSSGNYSFTVSYNWSGTVTPSKSGYTFSPSSRSYNNVTSNQTNQNYTATPVQGKPFIQVTSPNGGENLVVGNSYTVTWSSAYLTPGGTLYLFYRYDGAWHPITTLSSGASSFNWTIPKIPGKVTSPKPSGSIRSASLWIGNWVNGKWECYDKNDYKFRILYDGWLCKISKGDQGGATMMLDNGVFDGYGISLELGMFRIEGTYSLDLKGGVSGAYAIYEFDNPTNVYYTGNVTGSIDSSSKRMTLRLTTSDGTPVFSLSGKRLPDEPTIPGQWMADLSGSASGSLTSLQIYPYQLGDELYAYVFEFLGSGSLTGGSPINIMGYFYLTSKTVYGIYQITGAINESGILKGSLNPSSGKLTFTMINLNGDKWTLVGKKTTP